MRFIYYLYYKTSMTIPWRLPANPNSPATCFVGVSFYRSRDKKSIHTSVAQIFDELGNGVILRGAEVQEHKEDRKPFLSEEQAEILLGLALKEYKLALSHPPARLVLHKTSKYRDTEIAGFKSAAQSAGINSIDYVSILDTTLRLFRKGAYPPLRGTQIELNRNSHLLYTRGSVTYYRTYTGFIHS